MKNLPGKGSGSGSSVAQMWQEINKGGGEAPTLNEIKQILRGGEEGVMLTKSEVEQRITEYFQSKTCVIQSEDGQPVTIWKSAPTKSELAGRLGISLATLSRYSRGEYNGGRKFQGMTNEVCEPESFPVIHRAMLIISDFYERQLSLNKNNSGCIFWLLNSENEKWSNTQEVHVEKKETLEIKTLSEQIASANLVWDAEEEDFVPAGGTGND